MCFIYMTMNKHWHKLCKETLPYKLYWPYLWEIAKICYNVIRCDVFIIILWEQYNISTGIVSWNKQLHAEAH